MPDTGDAIIRVKEVTKSFMIGSQLVNILKGINFDITTGDFVIILGPSGCGKSTLLHIILGLEVPNTGTVNFLGEDIYNSTDEDYRSTFRKKHIGMVYQQSNWVKALNVGENVAFPLTLLGMEKSLAMEKARDMLKQVEMQDWFDYIPTQLSSGQQQRVSLARALINNPEIIIADEPTGNLDFTSGEEMMQLIADLNQERKKTVIMVTHDLEYVKYCKTVIKMLDGVVIGVFNGEKKEELFSQLKFKRGVEQTPTQSTKPAEPAPTQATPTAIVTPPTPIRVITKPTANEETRV